MDRKGERLKVQKITDERLILKNLKNIRVAYIVQMLGIISILGYDLVTKGMYEVIGNPLWFVLIISTIIHSYLSLSVSVDHESDKKHPQKGLTISLIVLVLITILIGFLVAISQGSTIFSGVIIGGIIFVCGFVPIVYIYKLRKKRKDE